MLPSFYPSPEKLNLQLRLARLDDVKSAVIEHIAGCAICGLFIYFSFSNASNQETTFYWLLSQIFCVCMAIPILWYFKKETNANNYKKQILVIYPLALTAGISWGLAPFAFTQSSFLTMPSFVICITALIAPFTIAPTFMMVAFGTFIACSLSIVTGIGVAVLTMTDYPPLMIIGALFLYCLALTLHSHRIHARQLNALLLQIKNEYAYKAATEANIQKSTFIASASHDIRQPLQACIYIIDNIYRQIHPESRPLINNLSECIQDINNLLSGLLDISRLDADSINNQQEYINIAPILKRLEENFSNTAEKKIIKLTFKYENCAIFCDSILLARVLSNLIDNAIKYSPAYSEVCIQTEIDNGVLKLEVIDQGIGMSEPDQQQVFNEFYQADNPERNQKKGLGLGLSIVKRLTEIMQIELSMLSSKGKGTTITLQLPAHDLSLLPQTKAAPQKGSINLQQYTLLLIEDNEIVRQSLSNTLESWLCTVISCESAEEAAEKIKHYNKVDLIISDYRLKQNKTGAEAIREINQLLPSPIPSIIITGDTSKESIHDAEKASDYLLHKPVKPLVLEMAIQHLVKK